MPLGSSSRVERPWALLPCRARCRGRAEPAGVGAPPLPQAGPIPGGGTESGRQGLRRQRPHRGAWPRALADAAAASSWPRARSALDDNAKLQRRQAGGRGRTEPAAAGCRCRKDKTVSAPWFDLAGDAALMRSGSASSAIASVWSAPTTSPTCCAEESPVVRRRWYLPGTPSAACSSFLFSPFFGAHRSMESKVLITFYK